MEGIEEVCGDGESNGGDLESAELKGNYIGMCEQLRKDSK